MTNIGSMKTNEPSGQASASKPAAGSMMQAMAASNSPMTRSLARVAGAVSSRGPQDKQPPATGKPGSRAGAAMANAMARLPGMSRAAAQAKREEGGDAKSVSPFRAAVMSSIENLPQFKGRRDAAAEAMGTTTRAQDIAAYTQAWNEESKA
jgi:hypothetical protein